MMITITSLTSWATSFIPRSFEDQIQRSGIIVEGEVTSITYSYSEDKKMIYTFVTIAPKEVLKGVVKHSSVELRFVGGQIKDDVIQVPGMPQFQKGQKGIYFLSSNFNPQKTMSMIEGMEQGQFIIELDDRGIERIAGSNRTKVLGFNEKESRLVTAKATSQRIAPIPVAGTTDRLVEIKSLQDEQLSITKDQFKSILRKVIDKNPRKDAFVYTPMRNVDRLQSIYFKPVASPKFEGKGSR